MNYSELIHDFLDGALEQAEEEELLLAVARQSDLREELRQAIALKTAFKTDFQALTPPMHLTNNIFSAMGFTAPGAAASSVAASSASASSVAAAGIARLGIGSRLGAIFGGFQNSLVSAITSSLLTAALLISWNYFMPQNGSRRAEVLMPTTTTYTTTPSIVPQRSLQADEHTRSHNEMWSASHRKTATEQRDVWQKHNDRYDNSENSTQLSATRSEQHTSNADQRSLHEFVSPTMPDNTDFTPPKQHTLTAYVAPAPIPTQVLASDKLTSDKLASDNPASDTFWAHLQIGARGIASMSLPQSVLPSNPSTFLRNTALSAMYRLSEQHQIGVEVGEDTYFQRFRMLEGENNVLNVQQNPSLLWAGIAYRYVAMPESTISPIFHAVLGGTQLGATGARDGRAELLAGRTNAVFVWFGK